MWSCAAPGRRTCSAPWVAPRPPLLGWRVRPPYVGLWVGCGPVLRPRSGGVVPSAAPGLGPVRCPLGGDVAPCVGLWVGCGPVLRPRSGGVVPSAAPGLGPVRCPLGGDVAPCVGLWVGCGPVLRPRSGGVVPSAAPGLGPVRCPLGGDVVPCAALGAGCGPVLRPRVGACARPLGGAPSSAPWVEGAPLARRPRDGGVTSRRPRVGGVTSRAAPGAGWPPPGRAARSGNESVSAGDFREQGVGPNGGPGYRSRTSPNRSAERIASRTSKG